MRRAYVLVENFYGSHQPAVFCECFQAELEEQNLSENAAAVCLWDAYTDNPDAHDLSADQISRLENSAYCGWEAILEKFVPEEGFHLGYMDHDQALFAIPNQPAPQDCPHCGADDVDVDDSGAVECWNCGCAAASIEEWNDIPYAPREELFG